MSLTAVSNPNLINPPTSMTKARQCNDWQAIEELLAHPAVRTCYLWGKYGTGKSYTSMRAGLNGRHAYAVTLTPETPAAELRGHWFPRGGEFVWQDGIFVRAMRNGSRIVINELSHASEDVSAILYPVLESPETAELTLPSLEVIKPESGFQVICTDNFAPDALPEALRDRFNVTLNVKGIHPNALLALKPELREIAKTTAMLDGDRYISVRSWLTYQALEEDFGPLFSLQAVFGMERAAELHSALTLAASGPMRD